MGAIPLGHAVMTGAGRLPFKAIIHVAGINLLWRASERSIRDSVTNATRLAVEHGFGSLALPLIGAGSGGMNVGCVRSLIVDQVRADDFPLRVRVVTFVKEKR